MQITLKGMLFFLIAVNSVSAQILATVKTETPYIDFLGKTDGGFMTAERNSENGFHPELYIRAYDDGLNLKSTTQVTPFYNENTQTILFKNQVLVIQKKTDGDDRKYYISNLISSDGSVNNKGIDIFKFNLWEENKKLNSDAYRFITKLSTTRNHVLFVYENDYKDDVDNEVTVRVMEGDNSLSETKNLSIPYGSNLSEVRGYVFDDSQGMKVIALVTFFDKEGKKRKVIRTELFELDLISGKQRSIELPVGSDYGTCKLFCSDGTLLMGFLKKDAEENMFTGFRFIGYKDSVIFSGDVNLNIALSGKFRFMKGQADTYKIRNIEVTGDRKIIAIVEKNNRENYHNSTPIPGNPGMSTGTIPLGGSSEYYTAEDLYIMGIDYSGGNKFVQVIKKSQNFPNPAFVSYLFLKGEKKSKLVFTDDSAPVQYDPNEESISFPGQKAYKMNCYNLRDSLTWCKCNEFVNPFFDQSRKFRFQTKSYLSESDNTFVIAATIKNKESYLMRVKLND